MSQPNRTELESRVLVLAPTGKDGANSKAVLGKAGLACAVCRDVTELCREIEAGVGAVLLTEEALSLDKATTSRGHRTANNLPSIIPRNPMTLTGIADRSALSLPEVEMFAS